jgi:hypothetical protein
LNGGSALLSQFLEILVMQVPCIALSHSRLQQHHIDRHLLSTQQIEIFQRLLLQKELRQAKAKRLRRNVGMLICQKKKTNKKKKRKKERKKKKKRKNEINEINVNQNIHFEKAA